jgi:uncharacterized Zn finger protein
MLTIDAQCECGATGDFEVVGEPNRYEVELECPECGLSTYEEVWED